MGTKYIPACLTALPISHYVIDKIYFQRTYNCCFTNMLEVEFSNNLVF